MVVLEQSTEPLAALDRSITSAILARRWKQDVVALPLARPLGVAVVGEVCERPPRGRLAEEDHESFTRCEDMSFGDLLVSHPHAQALVSRCVFLRDGSFYSMEDVDFTGLEAVFRVRVFSFLIQAGKITQEVAQSMRTMAALRLPGELRAQDRAR